MQHKLKLTAQEKIKACLELSDLVFKMTKNMLSSSEFNKKMKVLRERHLKEDFALMESWGKVKK